MNEAKSFYFDIALSGNEYTLPLLMQFAKKGHVMFGSDYPFGPEKTIGVMTRGWEKFAEGLGEEERWLVERGCAEGLFPRFKGVDGEVKGEGKVNGLVEKEGRGSGGEYGRKVIRVEHVEHADINVG